MTLSSAHVFTNRSPVARAAALLATATIGTNSSSALGEVFHGKKKKINNIK
jgi:hypothetical protein